MTQISLKPPPPIVVQQKRESCWAAVTACIFAWRTGIMTSDSEAAQQLGGQFKTIYDSDQPLLMPEVKNWAKAAAFDQLPPTNITVELIKSVLTQNKPLIVGKANANGIGHLVVLYSLSIDETSNGTTVQYMNPDSGGRYITTSFEKLAAEFEALAPSGSVIYAQLFKPL